MPRQVPGLFDTSRIDHLSSICSRGKMHKKGTETGGNNEEEGEEEDGEGGREERIGKEVFLFFFFSSIGQSNLYIFYWKEVLSERGRRRITALTAHTRPWLDPHYGK